MKLLFIILLLSASLFAQNSYSLRAAYGLSSASDLDELYTFQGLNTSPYDTSVYAIGGGYRLVEDMLHLPFDLYIKADISYFDENSYQSDFFEGVVYLKLFYKLDFFGNRVRIGFGEGVSYADKVPWVEHMEAVAEGDNESNFLNYLDVTVDFDLGKAFRAKALDEFYLGYLIKHRSGFHGTYGGVKDGGSNYNCLYIEKNF